MSKEKLSELSTTHKRKGTWLKDAIFRKENRKWLTYSSQIARRVLAKIDDNQDLTQAELARKLNVTPQQISKIVKGQENLTLETIAKLSAVLDTELISFPEYKFSTPILLEAAEQTEVFEIRGLHRENDTVFLYQVRWASLSVNTVNVSNEPTNIVAPILITAE